MKNSQYEQRSYTFEMRAEENEERMGVLPDGPLFITP